MKKLNPSTAPLTDTCNYPPPFNEPCRGVASHRLGRAAGLTAFGVNRTRIPPGAWSSQRHWHSHEDEFVMVLEGELTLVTNTGEETLTQGDCAAFKAGDPDGHHLINRTGKDAVVLEVGNADPRHDRCTYSDIDMTAEPGESGYRRKDGTPYSTA
jgi:uncharacterized cupin superfamily protein